MKGEGQKFYDGANNTPRMLEIGGGRYFNILPPWAGKLHATWLDGNPGHIHLLHDNPSNIGAAAPTPANIGASVGRLAAFMFQRAITVNTIRHFQRAATSAGPTRRRCRNSTIGR